MERIQGLWHNQAVLIAALLLSLSTLLVTVALLVRDKANVRYSAEHITPKVSALCPGEFLEYDVTVEIRHYPAVGIVSTSFCRAGEAGVCFNSLADGDPIPLADYRRISGTPKIPIPRSPVFTPGDYEYWHVFQNGDATGYVVPFSIRDDCPKE